MVELIKMPKISDLSKVFDYSTIRRIDSDLKRNGKPKLSVLSCD